MARSACGISIEAIYRTPAKDLNADHLFQSPSLRYPHRIGGSSAKKREGCSPLVYGSLLNPDFSSTIFNPRPIWPVRRVGSFFVTPACIAIDSVQPGFEVLS